MKNIMIIDFSQPYAFDIHRVNDLDYTRLFQRSDNILKMAAEFRKRGDIDALQEVFKRMWHHRIASSSFVGIDGVIVYEADKLCFSYLNAGEIQNRGLRARNIMLFDRNSDEAFRICSATEDEFTVIFPNAGQDVEFFNCLYDRLGMYAADIAIRSLQSRIIPLKEVSGIDGTLYLGGEENIGFFPNKMDSDVSRHYPLHD